MEPVAAQDAPLDQLDEVIEHQDMVSPTVAASLPEAMPDDLERIADKAFAISPRLGAVGESTAEAEKTAPPKNQSTHELLSRHEVHYRRDVHRFNHPHAASEFMDVPFNEANSGPSTYVDHSAPAPSSVADPLAKLLSGDELTSRPVKPRLQLEPDDDETFDVPLSIAERTRAGMISNELPAPIMEAPHPALQPTSPADLPQYVEPQTAPADSSSYDAPAGEPEKDVAPENPPAQSAETSTVSASATASPDPNPLTQPLGYPPLSGSPPPKRRQL
jgi:hypothetical protein